MSGREGSPFWSSLLQIRGTFQENSIMILEVEQPFWLDWGRPNLTILCCLPLKPEQEYLTERDPCPGGATSLGLYVGACSFPDGNLQLVLATIYRGPKARCVYVLLGLAPGGRPPCCHMPWTGRVFIGVSAKCWWGCTGVGRAGRHYF